MKSVTQINIAAKSNDAKCPKNKNKKALNKHKHY